MKSAVIILLAVLLTSTVCIAQQQDVQAEADGQAQAQDKALWEEDAYFTLGFGFGVAFPLGLVSEVMDLGVALDFCSDLYINFPWGALGFGLMAGVLSETANDTVTSPYNMSSIPIAFNVRYVTRFMVPFYLSLGISAGAVLNVISYRDSFYDDISRPNWRYFVAPSVGAGLYITRQIGVSLWGALPIIPFNVTPYVGATAGLRIDYFL